jgi:hypothetical protein
MTKIRLDELKAALEMRRPPAAKSEAAYKTELVDGINQLPGARARRVEDRWAVGVLDLNIKPPGRSFIMAEGKLIHGYQFSPSEAQYVEGLKWQTADVECVLIGWKAGQMFLSPWVEKADCRECFTDPGLAYAPALMEFLK